MVVQGDKGSLANLGNGQGQLFLVDPIDVKKLLEWFRRAIEKAGNQIKAKAEDVICSAQVLLAEVDKEREKERQITEGVMLA